MYTLDVTTENLLNSQHRCDRSATFNDTQTEHQMSESPIVVTSLVVMETVSATFKLPQLFMVGYTVNWINDSLSAIVLLMYTVR